MTDRTVSRTVRIDADPQTIYALVSDLPRMGEWSPENAGGRWRKGVTQAAPGATFKGANRNGWRRWSTTATVSDADPGRRFAFSVTHTVFSVADWSYDLVPVDGGTATDVTETWHDRRSAAFAVVGQRATGVSNRADFTATSIEHTLAALKREAERVGAVS